MGSSRVSGQRVGNAGRQFAPHGAEADGGVVRPGRLGGLPPSRRTHSAECQRASRILISRAIRYFYATVMSIGGQVTRAAGRNPRRPADENRRQSGSSAQSGRGDGDAAGGGSGAVRSGPVREGSRKAARNRLGRSSKRLYKTLSLGDGSGLRFLSETVSSPSLDSLRAEVLKKFPKAKWVEYEAVSRDNELAGAELAFGQPLYVASAVRQSQSDRRAGLRFPGSRIRRRRSSPSSFRSAAVSGPKKISTR